MTDTPLQCCEDENCKNPVRFIRHTQFAGSHPFCEAHKLIEALKNKSDDGEWEDLLKNDDSLSGRLNNTKLVLDMTALIKSAHVLDVIQLIRIGIPSGVLARIGEQMDISLDLTANLVGSRNWILERQIRNRERLSLSESDKLINILNIIDYVRGMIAESPELTEDFDVVQWTGQWLVSPNRALGNKSPVHYLDTSIGHQLVFNLLKQIESGTYA